MSSHPGEPVAGFARSGGALRCGGLPIAEIAGRVRTAWPESGPFYLYDLDLLAARVERFRRAFAALRPHVAFALKANGCPALLARLASLAVGADVVSEGEIRLAERAGFAARTIVLNGNGKSSAELDWAARSDAHSLNLDGMEEIDLLAAAAEARGRRVRVAVRLNPELPTPGHPHVATGTPHAKFGLPADEALAALERASRRAGLQAAGVHVHLGSQILEPGPLLASLEAALAFRERALARGLRVAWINLGGGFGVPYADHETEFPLESFAAELARRVLGLEVEWVLEPGRWLAAPCGALVARVLRVKRQAGRRVVVLDAGMTDLLRPALYGARHRIEPAVPRSGSLEAALVVGPVCESADVFDPAAALPPLEPGDVVAVLDAGAYGYAMSSRYNGRPRGAEVGLERGRLRVLREPETWEDLERGACDRPLG